MVDEYFMSIPVSTFEMLCEIADKLAVQLEKITDQHHRTLTNSRFHDPEQIESFEFCPCLTCQASTEILSKYRETKKG
jgi:hypothetical protein